MFLQQRDHSKVLLCTSEKVELFRLGFGGLTRLVYWQFGPACQRCHRVLVGVNTVKPQKDTVFTSLHLCRAGQDRSRRRAETYRPSCSSQTKVRAPRHAQLQTLHWRLKVERRNSPVPPCPTASQKKPNSAPAPGPQVKHNSSSFKPDSSKTCSRLCVPGQKACQAVAGVLENARPRTGCPHQLRDLIWTGSNKTEPCAGHQAQRLGASNSLSAQEQGKTTPCLQESIRDVHLAVRCTRVWSCASLTCQRGKARGLEPGVDQSCLLCSQRAPSQHLSKRTSKGTHHFLTAHQHDPRPASGCLLI